VKQKSSEVWLKEQINSFRRRELFSEKNIGCFLHPNT
jgi:hypothetical protein